MRPMRRLMLVFAATALGGCVNPRVQENIAQAMIDVGNELAGLRQDVATLQQTVDSLRMVAARQDTVIEHLATLAGLPLTHRP